MAYSNESVRRITQQLHITGGITSRTMSGNETWDGTYSVMQIVDPGGAARTITLPAEEGFDGAWFVVRNAASDVAELLTIQNDGSTTIDTLDRGQWAIFGCDGSSWYRVTGDPDNTLLTVTGTIANASVQTLNATPVELVPAPGAGLYLEPVSCHWMLDHGGVDFDDAAAGEDLSVKYTNASGAKVFDDVDHSGFGDASADAHKLVFPASVTPVANAAFVAHILSGEWYSAAGDSDLRYRVSFRIRPFDLSA